MRKNLTAFVGTALFGGGLYGLVSSSAMALPPLQCQDFVNFAMQISGKYAGRSCPPTPLMHLDRDRSFKWCLGKNAAQVEADKQAKIRALKKCTG